MRLASLAWRGLLARPLRSALAVVGIGLGVAVVTATMIAGSSSEQALRSATADLLGAADVRLRAFADEGFAPRTVQAVRSLPDVVAVAPVAERRITVSTAPGSGERVFTLLVLGIDPSADREIRTPSIAEGIGLSADSPTDAVVPASFAAENGLDLGDELLLSGRRQGMPPLRIVGLASNSGLAAVENGEVLITARTTLDDAFEIPAPIRYLDVDLGDDPDAAAIDRLTAALDEPFIVETADDAAARFASAQAGFTGTALLFGLVALAVGGFLAGNTMAMTVGERTRELGLLRAAGTTSRQVLGIVARQALALGVAGSAVGVLAGILLAAGIIGFLDATRAVLVAGLPMPVGALLVAFLLGVAVTMVAAVVPALRAARLSPLDALRPPWRAARDLGERLWPLVLAELGIVLIGLVAVILFGERTPLLPIAVSMAILVGGAVATAFVLDPLGRVIGRPFEWFFGAQGLLGRVNLSRDRARTGLTVGAMMIALAAVVAMGTIAESARAGAERRVASILPGGHAIRAGAPLPVDDFRESFEATAGIAAASPVLEIPVVRLTGDAQEEAVLAGIDPGLFEDAGALLIEGTSREAAFAALRAGGAVLVPRALATRADIGVGDQLAVAVPGGAASELTVAGLVEYSIPGRTPDGDLLVSAADARDRFGATSARLWVMVPRDDVADSAFAAAVRETAVQLAAEPLTVDQLATDVSGALHRLTGLFDALAFVAVVIAALGIVNTLGVSIGERVREIAILRSNGMTVGQVQAMVVTEAAIMGAIAAVLAIAAGLLVALALVSAGTSGELSAGVQLPWPLLVAVVLLGMGLAALAGLYPARVAASLSIVGNLKHFE